MRALSRIATTAVVIAGRLMPAYRLSTAALASTLALAPVTAASAEPVSYSNPRFGTTVTFPGEVFSQPQPPPVNGDGMTFMSPDGARLAVWGGFNALEQTPKELADWEVENLNPGSEVTYRRIAKDWVVLSGFDGDKVFYKRFKFGTRDIIHGLLLTYPKSRKATYDRLVGRIADSFGGP